MESLITNEIVNLVKFGTGKTGQLKEVNSRGGLYCSLYSL